MLYAVAASGFLKESVFLFYESPAQITESHPNVHLTSQKVFFFTSQKSLQVSCECWEPNAKVGAHPLTFDALPTLPHLLGGVIRIILILATANIDHRGNDSNDNEKNTTKTIDGNNQENSNKNIDDNSNNNRSNNNNNQHHHHQP